MKDKDTKDKYIIVNQKGETLLKFYIDENSEIKIIKISDEIFLKKLHIEFQNIKKKNC